MEREKIYALMMSALDGEELTAADSAEMDAYLLHDTELAQEWESMQRVDTLFRLTPLVAPPANFAQRTIERLPTTSRNHVWAVSAFYLALLIGGLIPIVAGLWFLTAYGGILQQTAVFQALNQTVGVSLQALGAVLSAVGTVAANAVNDQPFVMGWIFLLLGVVVMWRNVYHYMLQPTPLPVRSVRR